MADSRETTAAGDELRTMPGSLTGRTVILGVSGSIAVVKAPHIAQLLQAAGARVQIALTPAALEFLTVATFAPLSPHPVLTDADLDDDLANLLPDATDYLIAPASARTLANLAFAGPGLLAAIARRMPAPPVVAPAMEPKMYGHPATARHIRTLLEQGVRFIGPAEGRLASGAVGRGRLLEPADLIAEFAAG